RLQLGVVDVRRDDGAAARDLAAHEFRRDESRHAGAEAFAVGERGFRAFELPLAAEILALGDVDHFSGDDAGTRPFELSERLAIERVPRLWHVREIARQMLAGDIAVVDRLHLATLIFLDAGALFHPFDAGARQAFLNVDRHIGISIWPRGVIDRQRRLA